jgi:tripartite-type tricarboxylate transporter receptor subunit TctC
VPVSLTGTYPYIVFANAALHVRTLAELIAAAKARPGVITFGTNGVGSTHHVAWERFERAAGISLSHIPYKSSSPAFQDLLADNISLMVIAISSAYPYLHDSRVVALANNAATRSPLLPDLPTVVEQGQPKFELSAWLGMFAPKGTPPALVDQISAAIKQVSAMPDYRAALAQRGTDAVSSTPKALADEVRVQYDRTRADVHAMGIKPN